MKPNDHLPRSIQNELGGGGASSPRTSQATLARLITQAPYDSLIMLLFRDSVTRKSRSRFPDLFGLPVLPGYSARPNERTDRRNLPEAARAGPEPLVVLAARHPRH